MSTLTTPSTVTTPSPRFGRGTVIAITAAAGVIAVGAVTLPRLTTATPTGTVAVPVVAPSGVGGGAPSAREIAAQQRQQRSQLDAMSSGIRAMDPRAWTGVAAAMAATGAVPRSADAAERWLSSGTSLSAVVPLPGYGPGSSLYRSQVPRVTSLSAVVPLPGYGPGSSLYRSQVPSQASAGTVKPTTPDVVERTGTGEPRPPHGLQRPRD